MTNKYYFKVKSRESFINQTKIIRPVEANINFNFVLIKQCRVHSSALDEIIYFSVLHAFIQFGFRCSVTLYSLARNVEKNICNFRKQHLMFF